MRRYELMVVIRPDAPEDVVQGVIDRATRAVIGAEGQIIKVSPWGRRRLAYPIGQYREGSYFIVVFDSPPEAIAELERQLNITEEVMRHLVTRVERPAAARRPASDADESTEEDGEGLPPDEDEEPPDGEFIDESESEAAPAATDR